MLIERYQILVIFRIALMREQDKARTRVCEFPNSGQALAYAIIICQLTGLVINR